MSESYYRLKQLKIRSLKFETKIRNRNPKYFETLKRLHQETIKLTSSKLERDTTDIKKELSNINTINPNQLIPQLYCAFLNLIKNPNSSKSIYNTLTETAHKLYPFQINEENLKTNFEKLGIQMNKKDTTKQKTETPKKTQRSSQKP